MSTAKRWLGVAALVTVVGSAACGGGESTSAPLTKAAFIEQADRMCAEANTKLEALAEPQSIQQLENVLRTGETTTRALLADLRSLGSPSQDRETLNRVYALVEQGLAKIDAAVAAISSGDVAMAQTLAEEGQALFDQANTASASYGFKDCAE